MYTKAITVNEFNKDLGYFNLFPNELFTYLAQIMDPNTFLCFRKSHAVVASKFSQTYVLNHFYKKSGDVARMVLFEHFYKNLTMWGVKHMVVLGYRDVEKGIKYFITRNFIHMVKWLLYECGDSVHVSFENNFILRWAYRKNNLDLIRYIVSRPELKLSINNYSLMESIARYFTWNKFHAVRLIFPIFHLHLMESFIKYACKYNNVVVFNAFDNEYFQHDLEVIAMKSSIKYESIDCLNLVLPSVAPLIEWLYVAMKYESIFSFDRILNDLQNLPSETVQNELLVEAAFKGNVLFLERMKKSNFQFSSTLNLIGVYAIVIFHNWKEPFSFLLENYPLKFSNYKVQWLLFFCVNINAPFFFHALVNAGYEPMPINPKNVKVFEMSDVYDPLLSIQSRMEISHQRKEINMAWENYYVFFCQKLYIPSFQQHISFEPRIIETKLDEQEDVYFLQFKQPEDLPNWEHFNMWLERDDMEWYEIVNPSPAFSKEITFNISHPNIEYNVKNPFQKFQFYFNN
jgi:hypothetical protein